MLSARGGEVVVSEPSVVAVDTCSRRSLAAGNEALELLGRDGIAAIRPLKHGVIVDLPGTEELLGHLIGKVRRYRRPPPRVIAAVPSGVSGVQRRAVAEACMAAGAREPRLVAATIAAAEEEEVLALRMRVLSPTHVIIEKLNSLNEHNCNFAALLPGVRAVRERVDWDRVRADTARRAGVDLMLSGHVHGGQIRFPLIGSVLIPSQYGRRYDCGTFDEPPTVLHVSRGLSGKEPLRFRCHPQVTRITLRLGGGKG